MSQHAPQGIRKTEAFESRDAGESVFLIPTTQPSADVLYELTGDTALFVWKILDGSDLPGVLDAVCAAFDADARAAAEELQAFVKKLASIGAVRFGDDPAGKPVTPQVPRKPYTPMRLQEIRLRELLPENLIVQGCTGVGGFVQECAVFPVGCGMGGCELI
ncbi:MAG: PqqD family peptide modification chaperone [Planctomycetes bacterium]|nr:PqqD family peptide modification chaperone [Planctomycetota bacterium]